MKHVKTITATRPAKAAILEDIKDFFSGLLEPIRK